MVLGSSFILLHFLELIILTYGQLENLSVLRLVLADGRIFFNWMGQGKLMSDSFFFLLLMEKGVETFSLKLSEVCTE